MADQKQIDPNALSKPVQSSEGHCPVCGALLDAGRLAGLCPACIWGSLTKIDADLEPDEPPRLPVAGKSLLPIRGHVVLEEIARGGMGIVYRARQLEPDRVVALKMLLPHQLASASMRERFRIEIRAIASLDHPAILPVHVVGEHDSLPFFTMKFAGGGTLATRLPAYRGKYRDIAALCAILAEAVQFAHSRGVLHRDLKPGNILFDDADRPYVSDFGLAKFKGVVAEGLSVTRSIRLEGTPQFLPPEIASGAAREATTSGDIYSLGAILFELLTGQPPFQGDNLAVLLRTIAEQPPPRPSRLTPGVPADLEVICLKCLAKDPLRRYGSAGELARDLRLWLTDRPILARPVPGAERVWKWARRNPITAALAALLLIAVIAAASALHESNRKLQQALASSRAGLRRSLLAQARFQRATGRAGQRFETLELLHRATPLSGAERFNAPLAVALRTEAAGALALPDLRITARWPVFVPHYEAVFDFTPDLAHYASAAAEGGFAIFSTATRTRLRHFPGATNNPALRLRFSDDGRWIAATFQDGHAELHSLGSPAPPSARWPGQVAARTAVEFSPDSRAALVSILGRGVLWRDLETGQEREFFSEANRPEQMAFDPTARLLATSIGPRCDLWDVTNRTKLWSQLLDHRITKLAWSPDGFRIAVAYANSQTGGTAAYGIGLLHSSTGGLAGRFFARENSIDQLAFHPAGDSVISIGWHGRCIWQSILDQGALLADGVGLALRVAPNGKRIGFSPSREELAIAELATPAVFRTWRKANAADEEVYGMSLSPDGAVLATAGEGGIHLWDTASRTETSLQPLPAKNFWTTLFFHPDGKSVVYSAANFGVRQADLKRVPIAGGRLTFQLGPARRISPGDAYVVQEFAPDQRSLVVGEIHQQTRNDRVPPTFWLWPDGDPTRARKLAADFPMMGYRFAAGGRWGITTDFLLSDLWLWNPATGQRVRSLNIPLGVVSQVSHDGRWVITSTREEFVVWDTTSWEPRSRWPARPNQRTGSECVCSPDGSLLAVFDTSGRIDLFTIPEGKPLIGLPPPQPMRFQALTFSPAGDRLYALRANGVVYEWDLGALRKELRQAWLDWK